MRNWMWMLGVCVLAGCGGANSDDTGTSQDALHRRHPFDAGIDSGVKDSGSGAADSGTPDSGTPADAGSPSPDAGSASTLPLYDDFNGPLYTITTDGSSSPNGKWNAAFVSYGFVKTVQDPTNPLNQFLQTAPKMDVLRSVRYDTTSKWNWIHGKLSMRLDSQLQPNPYGWYTAWPLLANVDMTTGFYFNLKTNGWELGKKDNDLPPADELQEYLQTGNSPAAVIGQWYTIEWWVVPSTTLATAHLRVDVNGSKVVEMDDNQPWQRNGTTGTGTSPYFMNSVKWVSLYNEASQVSWDDVYIGETTTIP